MYMHIGANITEQKLCNSYNAYADFLLNQKYVNKSKNELSDAMWMKAHHLHGLQKLHLMASL